MNSNYLYSASMHKQVKQTHTNVVEI